MDQSIEIRSFQSADRWDQLVNESPLGTIFHTTEWLSIQEKTLYLNLSRLGAFREGKLVGLLPIGVLTRKFINRCQSPPISFESPYGGPVVHPDTVGVVRAFVKYLMKLFPLGEVRFSPYLSADMPSYSDVHLFSSILNSKCSAFIHLRQPESSLWKALHKSARRMVRKATKLGVKIRLAHDPDSFESYFDMLCAVYERDGMKPLPKDFYRQIFATFRLTGVAKLLTATYDEKVIAASLFLIHKDRINYWTGASLRDYLKLGPNNLIHWQAMKMGREAGLSVYDLGGFGRGYGRFKLSLGSKLIEYPRITWARRPLNVLYRLYTATRSIARRQQ